MPEDSKSFYDGSAKLTVYINYCDAIEKNIDRRYLTNRFYFTVLAATIAAIGYLTAPSDHLSSSFINHAPKLLSVAWFVISISWLFQILRFREISRVKFEVALEMEKELEIAAYSRESVVTRRSNFCFEYTQIELLLPAASILFSVVSFFLA